MRDQNNYDLRVRRNAERKLYQPFEQMTQERYDDLVNLGDPQAAEQYAYYFNKEKNSNVADKTKTMNKTDDNYGYFKEGAKGMGQSGKFGDAWALADNGTNTSKKFSNLI